MSDNAIHTFGPDVEAFRITARQIAMEHYVAMARRDQRPATQRAMDTYKAGEAKIVLAGGTSDLLAREAALRGIMVEQLAYAVLGEARKCELIELDRVGVSLAIDAAADHQAIIDALAAKDIPIPA